MRHFLSCFCLCMILVSCSGNTSEEPDPSQTSCQQLDSLFTALKNWESESQSDPDLSNSLSSLESFLGILEDNQLHHTDSCNFLDHSFYPDQSRFSFTETLVERSIRDTLSAGIYYLLKTRNIFGRDPEITEYLSEEMASLAQRNPYAYVLYLEQNEEQQNMVMSSTRWPRKRLEKLESLFADIPNGEIVSAFLKDLREELSIQ